LLTCLELAKAADSLPKDLLLNAPVGR
jgi:hypothetical protein